MTRTLDILGQKFLIRNWIYNCVGQACKWILTYSLRSFTWQGFFYFQKDTQSVFIADKAVCQIRANFPTFPFILNVKIDIILTCSASGWQPACSSREENKQVERAYLLLQGEWQFKYVSIITRHYHFSWLFKTYLASKVTSDNQLHHTQSSIFSSEPLGSVSSDKIFSLFTHLFAYKLVLDAAFYPITFFARF